MPEKSTTSTLHATAAVSLLLLGALLFSAGCKDKDAGQIAPPVGMNNQPPARQDNAANTPPPQQMPDPTLQADGEQTTEEVAEPEYTGPKVLVEDFSVKLPFAEYNEAGRYDIKCKVKTEEQVDSSIVWEIIAYSDSGEVVGSKELHLVLYDSDFKPLDLNSFYCTARPASLEFRKTDKQPSKPGDGMGGDEGDGQGGSGAIPGIKG